MNLSPFSNSFLFRYLQTISIHHIFLPMRRNTNFRIAGEKNFTLRLESKRWFPTTLSLSIVVFVQVTRATTLSQESHLSENAVRPSWNLSAGFIPARIDISLRCPRILFLLEHTAALFFLPFVRPSEWRAMSHDRTISDAEDREIKGETEVTTMILWKLYGSFSTDSRDFASLYSLFPTFQKFLRNIISAKNRTLWFLVILI